VARVWTDDDSRHEGSNLCRSAGVWRGGGSAGEDAHQARAPLRAIAPTPRVNMAGGCVSSPTREMASCYGFPRSAWPCLISTSPMALSSSPRSSSISPRV
jgi:hypothetical protein